MSATIVNLGDVAVEHDFSVSYYLDGVYVGVRDTTYLAAGGCFLEAWALEGPGDPRPTRCEGGDRRGQRHCRVGQDRQHGHIQRSLADDPLSRPCGVGRSMDAGGSHLRKDRSVPMHRVGYDRGLHAEQLCLALYMDGQQIASTRYPDSRATPQQFVLDWMARTSIRRSATPGGRRRPRKPSPRGGREHQHVVVANGRSM